MGDIINLGRARARKAKEARERAQRPARGGGSPNGRRAGEYQELSPWMSSSPSHKDHFRRGRYASDGRGVDGRRGLVGLLSHPYALPGLLIVAALSFAVIVTLSIFTKDSTPPRMKFRPVAPTEMMKYLKSHPQDRPGQTPGKGVEGVYGPGVGSPLPGDAEPSVDQQTGGSHSEQRTKSGRKHPASGKKPGAKP